MALELLGSLFLLIILADVNSMTYNSRNFEPKEKPKVEIIGRSENTPWTDDWELVDLGNNETNLIAKHRNNLVLNLVCSHLDKTKWDYENYFNVDNQNTETQDCEDYKITSKFQSYRTSNRKRTFSIRFEKSSKPQISKARCSPYRRSMYEDAYSHSPEQQTRVNIFVPGDSVLIQRSQYASHSKLRNYNSTWISCLNSDPRIPVSLFTKDPTTGVQEEITNATYDPFVGFFSKETLRDVIYICSAGVNESMRFVKYPQQNHKILTEEFTVESLEENVLFIKPDAFETLCAGTDYDIVSLILQSDLISASHHENQHKIKILQPVVYPIWIRKDAAEPEDIRVAFPNNNLNGVEVVCVKEVTDSHDNTKGGQILRILALEPKRKTLTNQIVPSNASYYYMSKEGIGFGITIHAHDAEDILYMQSKGGYTMYSDGISNFTCKGKFGDLVEKNGTFWMELIDGTSVAVQTDSLKTLAEKNRGRSFAKWTLSVKLPMDAVAIKCVIPMSLKMSLNLYLAAERRFRTSNFSPSIISNQANQDTRNSEVFNVGDLYRDSIFQEEIDSKTIKTPTFSSAAEPIVEIVGKNDGTSWTHDWELVDLGNDKVNLIAKHRNNLVLNLVCSHPEETKWNLLLGRESNHFNLTNEGTEIRDCEENKQSNGTQTRKRTYTISFEQSLKPQVATAECCTLYADTYCRSYKQTNIFIPGDTILMRTEWYSPDTGEYFYDDRWNPKYIPCLNSDPRIPVSLFAEDPQTGAQKEVTNITYVPLTGFLSNQTLTEEVYICSTGVNDSILYRKYINNSPDGENLLFLKVKDIQSQCDGTEYNVISLTVKQRSLDNPNKTKILHPAERPISIRKDLETFKDIEVAFINDDLSELFILCIREETESNTSLKGGQVLRLLKVYPEWEIISIETSPSNESYWLSLKNGSPYRRVSWTVTEIEDVLYMISKGGYTMYANETSTFICKYDDSNRIKYDFELEFKFRIELMNGTSFIVKNESSKTWPESYKDNSREFQNWPLSLKLPTEAVAVKCEISISLNPYLYMAGERRFQTSYLRPPIISNSVPNNGKVFKVEDGNKKLICKGEGDPQPKYIWTKDNKKKNQLSQLNLKTTVDRNGYGVLEFPLVTKLHEGTYLCNATSRIGWDSSTFSVSVQDKNYVLD